MIFAYTRSLLIFYWGAFLNFPFLVSKLTDLLMQKFECDRKFGMEKKSELSLVLDTEFTLPVLNSYLAG